MSPLKILLLPILGPSSGGTSKMHKGQVGKPAIFDQHSFYPWLTGFTKLKNPFSGQTMRDRKKC